MDRPSLKTKTKTNQTDFFLNLKLKQINLICFLNPKLKQIKVIYFWEIKKICYSLLPIKASLTLFCQICETLNLNIFDNRCKIISENRPSLLINFGICYKALGKINNLGYFTQTWVQAWTCRHIFVLLIANVEHIATFKFRCTLHGTWPHPHWKLDNPFTSKKLAVSSHVW